MTTHAFAIGLAILAVAFQSNAEPNGSATCGEMAASDQCRIRWSFTGTTDSYYAVQQFSPQEVAWQTLSVPPVSNSSRGNHDIPVEGGYLYRVLACEDPDVETNCVASTMVWAPIIQPEEQIHLIPSRVPLTGKDGKFYSYGMILKRDHWLTQVIQYNVYQVANAVARANVSQLPEMTPVADIRIKDAQQVAPVEQVQFNVYWAYSAKRGRPLDTPIPQEVQRPPHPHALAHPQQSPEKTRSQ